ncbi:hypothetical protein [Rothia koreensis]|uniref:hypothetical protein n=1 Tax=Rothia koreensis TaxID=592378 RepID=UPI003FCCB1F0
MSYKEQVAANVRAEAERYRVPVVDMAEALGIGATAMYARLSGVVPIKLDEIPELARMIGVPVEMLNKYDAEEVAAA